MTTDNKTFVKNIRIIKNKQGKKYHEMETIYFLFYFTATAVIG